MDSEHLVALTANYELFRRRMAERTPDNPALHGAKYYSQNDEDGVIEHIFDVVGVDRGTFVEIGCGHGIENMTAYLCLKGWSGVWVDANKEFVDFIRRQCADFADEAALYDRPGHVAVIEKFVTPDSVASTAKAGLAALSSTQFDFLSIDIDGNDLACGQAILEHYQPSVICMEYNSILGARSDFVFRTDGGYRWQRDDYMGCSLRGLTNGLAPFGYHLVACNMTGTNAFFVAERYRERFTPYEIDELFVPARYYEIPMHFHQAGHPRTLKNQLACATFEFLDT